MSPGFTPGPWQSNGSHIYGAEPKRDLVCQLLSGEGRLIDDRNLIAAAPDLLAALAWFIDDIDGKHTMMVGFDANVDRARAAIAKAEGK